MGIILDVKGTAIALPSDESAASRSRKTGNLTDREKQLWLEHKSKNGTGEINKYHQDKFRDI
jgi:hypothetical protein